MTRLSIVALAAVLAIAASPAYAVSKPDCDNGYKTFLGKMTAGDFPSGDIGEAIRRSLKAYDSCNAGDGLSPHGLWDDILAEMQKKKTK